MHDDQPPPGEPGTETAPEMPEPITCSGSLRIPLPTAMEK